MTSQSNGLDVKCPECEAPVGEPCRDLRNRMAWCGELEKCQPIKTPHYSRRIAARAVISSMTEHFKSSPSSGKHVLLAIEVPVIYTDDLDKLREHRGDFESESDWLLNCIALSGPVRLRVEVDGEKDSEVVEVWGSIREATLVEPSRGYELDQPHLTDEQLADAAGHKLLRDERACEWCMTSGEALRDD